MLMSVASLAFSHWKEASLGPLGVLGRWLGSLPVWDQDMKDSTNLTNTEGLIEGLDACISWEFNIMVCLEV